MSGRAPARLEKYVVLALRRRLLQWQSPGEMLRSVDEIGSEALFTQAGLSFLRDAWIAGTFGTAVQASEVRLMDRWPDFELRLASGPAGFEATEVDDPRRRRGDEYRQLDTGAQNVPIEEIDAAAAMVPIWLRAACERKAAKRYSGVAGLIIYLNFTEYGFRHREVANTFVPATSPAKDAFSEVWILWNDHGYLCWKNGEARTL